MTKLYAKKPPAESVHVVLVDEIDGVKGQLFHSMLDYAKKYGFTLLASENMPSYPTHDVEFFHVIYRTRSCYDNGVVSSVLDAIGASGTASIAMRYESWPHMYSFENIINTMKSRHGDRINFLMPDAEDDRGVFVSNQKLLDNSVCDTIRIKYVPHCISGTLQVPDHIVDYFMKCSRIFGEEHLYMRSKSDGYFAIRGGDGFYITATKTNKVDFDPTRISFVHKYDRFRNELFYSGPYLPSSDAVEAAVLLSQAPGISALMHTHASKQFTRNDQFRDRLLVPALAYGEPELGDHLVRALAEVGDGFVIMKEHGEVFAVSNGDSSDLFGRVESWLAESRYRLDKMHSAD